MYKNLLKELAEAQKQAAINYSNDDSKLNFMRLCELNKASYLIARYVINGTETDAEKYWQDLENEFK